MDIWHSLAGMVEVTLTAPEPEKALQEAALLGIRLERVTRVDELTFRFQISRREWKRLKALCQRKGWALTLRRRMGLYWGIRQLPRRPVLVAGLGLLVSLHLLLPTRVLFVEVEGNVTVPTREILAAAADSGVGFWAERRELRSERVKNALLEAIPELKWAGVNTRGCVATISVREREPVQAPIPQYSAVTAARDGFVLATTVTRGNALCAPGQTVRRGQTLISGYQDSGLCLRYTGAQGEILAETYRLFTAVSPTDWLEWQEETGVKRKISLRLGKKQINLWKDSGILEGTCGRMVREYEWTLPGGFRLPVTLILETYPQGQPVPVELTVSQETLEEFAESSLRERMVDGTILEKSQTVSQEAGCLRLTGRYVCRESIGQGITE